MEEVVYGDYSKIYHVQENWDLIFLDSYHLVDPFDPEIISVRFARKYFLEYYNLEPYEVWNLCHGLEQNFVPKCPVCGNDIEFYSLRYGWYNHCSRSCARVTQLTEQWKNSEYRNAIVGMLHSSEVVSKRNYTEFMQQGNPNDYCILYLAISNQAPEYFKFGATYMELYYKRKRDNYFTIHELVCDYRYKIAALEYELAKHFEGEYFLPKDFKRFKYKLKELLNKG